MVFKKKLNARLELRNVCDDKQKRNRWETKRVGVRYVCIITVCSLNCYSVCFFYLNKCRRCGNRFSLKWLLSYYIYIKHEMNKYTKMCRFVCRNVERFRLIECLQSWRCCELKGTKRVYSRRKVFRSMWKRKSFPSFSEKLFKFSILINATRNTNSYLSVTSTREGELMK